MSHIHKNAVKSDEHIVSVQSSMQFLPTLMPIIVLQRVEEQLPPLREVMLRAAVCLCADIRIISSYCEDLCGPKDKILSGNFMLLFIFCGLRF